MGEVITRDQLSAAIDMAAYPDDLMDTRGRYWSKWSTGIPGHFRVCKKCGKRITEGFMLHPHLETVICARHVKTRWI